MKKSHLFALGMMSSAYAMGADHRAMYGGKELPKKKKRKKTNLQKMVKASRRKNRK